VRKFVPAIAIWVVFEAIAIVLWLTQDNIFYLFNFTYIGTCIAVGAILMALRWKHARRFVQFAVGLYLLVFVGLIGHENMQVEGFWYYLFLGVFEGATIHYLVAKIAGPVLFGRGWCGYACWTVMVLDLLPWKRSPGRKQGIGWIRYALFAAALLLVGATLVFHVASEQLYFKMFIVGNIAYYAVGIALAAALHDNRAFCKYICPVGVFMKPGARVSIMRVVCDESKCVHCDACRRVCPMDVDMLDPSRSRLNGTECILCGECTSACPHNALDIKAGGGKKS
jgi:ferredoxin-type protein NapH